jgi:hypothetical protein
MTISGDSIFRGYELKPNEGKVTDDNVKLRATPETPGQHTLGDNFAVQFASMHLFTRRHHCMLIDIERNEPVHGHGRPSDAVYKCAVSDARFQYAKRHPGRHQAVYAAERVINKAWWRVEAPA